MKTLRHKVLHHLEEEEQRFFQLAGKVMTDQQKMKLHPKLSLWYLGTRENISELPGFVRLAATLGITEVYLQRLVYFQDHEGYGLARPEKTLMDSNAAVAELIHESYEIAKRSDVQFNASGLSNPLESLQTGIRNPLPWKHCKSPITSRI